MGELKPCPKCGSDVIVYTSRYRKIFCECKMCGYAGYSGKFKFLARANWNNEEYRKWAKGNKPKGF